MLKCFGFFYTFAAKYVSMHEKLGLEKEKFFSSNFGTRPLNSEFEPDGVQLAAWPRFIYGNCEFVIG
jgi:hypothetical protein